MRKETLYSMASPYREDLEITGYKFGHGKKAACIVGSIRGNEVQQLYICSQLIKKLSELEAAGNIVSGNEIMVVPSVNHHSMNIGKRFWAVDNTDINRMFPGYNLGETTQRIASGLFEQVKDYEYGIQFASFYMPGDFVPHVRMMDTGNQSPSLASLFGLPYVVVRKPKPIDTTTLNYNWQIWDTQAFSLYTRETDCVDHPSACQAVEAVLRFLRKKGLSTQTVPEQEAAPLIFREDGLHNILSATGGLLFHRREPGDAVAAGEVLADILDPCTGQVRERLRTAHAGKVFFAHKAQLIAGHDVAFRVLPEE